MSVDTLVESLGGDPGYVRFLLVERPYIRSAMTRMNAILDAEARSLSYSTVVGNALHNDLIELESWLRTLSPRDRNLLLRWAEGEEIRPVFGRARTASTQGSRRVRRLLQQYEESRREQEASL